MDIKRITITYIIFLTLINTAHAYKEIKTDGLVNLSEDVVLSNLLFENDRNIDEAKIAREVQNLYKTGFFYDVSAIYENEILYLKLTEVPIISSIKFNGLKKIPKDALLKELTTKERSFYSKSNVILDAKKIEMIYKSLGVLDAVVDPMIEFLDGGKIIVIFNIEEAKQKSISNIYFEGNKSFSDYTLKEFLQFKEDRWYRIFSSRTGYNVNQVLNGIEGLETFYKTEGFAKAKTEQKLVSLNEDGVDIVIFINEGKKYYFGGGKVINNIPNFIGLNDELGNKLIAFKPGQKFNIEQIQKTKYNIQNILQKEGYLSAQIQEEYEYIEDQAIVNVKFVITETKRIYIGKINFFGNVKTNDEVIRREFVLAEGDVYDTSKIRRSIQRIRNLQFFADVQLKEEQVSEDKVNINIFVEEGRTISADVGLGYDFGSDFSLTLKFNEANLFGTGISTSMAIEKGRYNESIDFSIVEPYLYGRDLAIISSTGLYNVYNPNLNTYKSNSLYQSIRGVYSISEYLKHSIGYSIKYDVLEILSPDEFFLTNPIVFEQEGKYLTSTISHAFTYDRRDFINMPTSGYLLQFSQSVAGIGGNINYISHELSGEQYFTTFGIDSLVLGIKLKGKIIRGWGGKDVNIKDRLTLGGATGLRGFDFNGVGPKFLYFNINDLQDRTSNYGGLNSFVGNIEYRFPNFLPQEFGFTTFVFYDFGTVFGTEPLKVQTFQGFFLIEDSKKIRSSAGIGMSWNSPMGVIGISYAHPLTYERNDERKRFFLNIGGFTL